MCLCEAEPIFSEYYTTICPSCGVERSVAISISPQFSHNQTLCVGYSRINRFRIILDQLFNPLVYGKPNSHVLFRLNKVKRGTLKNGHDMICWLTSLQISDKRYQCTHYYYKWFHKDNYIVPQPPCKSKVRELETKFSFLETNFTYSDHSAHSFFSYNWLLRKLISEQPSLLKYLPFVKRIKCPHRYDRYDSMYNELTNAGSAVKVKGDAEDCQIQPAAPLDDGSLSQNRPGSFFLNLLARIHQSKQAPLT